MQPSFRQFTASFTVVKTIKSNIFGRRIFADSSFAIHMAAKREIYSRVSTSELHISEITSNRHKT